MKRPSDLKERARRHFGRRGGILTLFGICFIFLGIGFIQHHTDRFSRIGPGGPLEFMDSWPPGAFWLFCGVIALMNGIIRRRIKNEDAVGYAALIMPPLLWMFAYLTSFLQWVFTRSYPEGPYGQEDSYLGAIVFTIIVIIIRTVANWPDDMDIEDISGIKKTAGSTELAMLDRMTETKHENDERGIRTREASEAWIQQARMETEKHIQASANENDRMIQLVQDEAELGRVNNERRDKE